MLKMRPIESSMATHLGYTGRRLGSILVVKYRNGSIWAYRITERQWAKMRHATSVGECWNRVVKPKLSQPGVKLEGATLQRVEELCR